MPAAKNKTKKRPRKKLEAKKKEKTNQHKCDSSVKNGCPYQASKQLKPNGQMERIVKIETKWPDGKDSENDEERSRRKRDGKKSITPTQSKTTHGN